MSAIGSYQVMRREDWEQCLACARGVRSETTGKWLFKKTEVVGLQAFSQIWKAAVLERVDFGYSGYVLGNYLDAQEEINGDRLIDEQSEPAITLSRVFTAAFPFEVAVSLPALPRARLLGFCREEYGDDEAPGMVEAINAAHAFYQRGLSHISPEKMVVFLIK